MIHDLVTLLIYLLVLGIVIALIYWVLDAIPVPQPINRIVKIVVIVVVALVLIMLLLQLLGGPDVGGHRLLPQ
jgi:multisubunit Na+/H+ antiporter MnhB subunit